MIPKRSVGLRALTGERFRFEPGAICLELALTGGEGYRALYETLHRPEDLARWLQGFVGVEVAPVTDADLDEAKRLREGIRRCVDARADGDPVPRERIEQVNRFAIAPPSAPQLGRDGRRRWAEPVTSSQVLSTLARDLIDVLTGPLADRVRRCAGVNCSLVFVDASRPGRRRWCSMERCGNRAKIRAFRDRQGKEAP